MEIRKTRIHGKIENKFTIKNKEGLYLLESVSDTDDDREPALFNSSNDAVYYLRSVCEVPAKEIKDFIIESHPISYFDNGGVLVEVKTENYISAIIVKEFIDELEKIKDKNNLLVFELVPIADVLEFRLSATITDISIDEDDKCITFSNYKDKTTPILDINKIIDELKDYKDYKIKLEVCDDLKGIIYNQYMIDYVIKMDKLTKCIRLFTLKIGQYKF